ncbi:peptidylprolyl isomerase [Candidatus Woesearchaeota archaeon]|nr:peptidylprolyl isomerase [Candidatus Woesearchaeota archaeon]
MSVADKANSVKKGKKNRKSDSHKDVHESGKEHASSMEHSSSHGSSKAGRHAKDSSGKGSSGKRNHEQDYQQENGKGISAYWIAAVVILGILAISAVVVYMDKLIPEKPPVQTEMGTLVLTVNGEPVYSREIEKRLSYYQAQYGPTVTEEFVINQTINEMLLLQEATEQGIVIDEARIDEAVDNWLGRVKDSVTTEQLDEILQKENLTMEEFIEDTRDAYKRNFIIYELLNESVLSKIDYGDETDISVTDEELRAEFESNPDIYCQVNASHILVCFNGASSCEKNRTKEEAKALIDDIYEQLLNNADFAEIAAEYSDCPSSEQGGVLGWISRMSQMDAVFLDELFKLKHNNQFSEPFLTDFGYHIAKINQKLDQFEDFETQISFQLQMQKQINSQSERAMLEQLAVEKYLETLRSKAVVINNKEELTDGIEPDPSILTFSVSSNEPCYEEGKPVIRLYTTTTCPHCSWVKETFDKVALEYVNSNRIIAHHWEFDTGDDTLSSEVETKVPDEEEDLFLSFSPRGGVPAFVMGCKYYRIGNGYESEKSLDKEEAELRAVIEKLIAGAVG